ncbi:MAG: acyl-CoA dehydrogenase family protein [Burkholderiaceae bacterium]|jgi:putative acyl-CoA dehydrogenase|nr:acyl-CoA dehydrogenase family protein [Burkholderiaceae bacterium]
MITEVQTGIHPNNQVPELFGYNLYTSDPILRAALARAGASWGDAQLLRQGAEYGSEAALRMGEDAEVYAPELRTHSPTGERIDFVKFHPAWHEAMAMARRNGITNRPYIDTRASAWTVYGASLYMHSQIEPGSCCPSVMTKASIPVLQRNPALLHDLWPKLADTVHDPRDIPLTHKRSITVGMGLTEKQGGSDLRSNVTRAERVGHAGPWGDEFLITGHKWFLSAPMCDAHLVLAQTEAGTLSCFYVPRWQPDGRKNAIHLQRLKDKVGNRSNSSSEAEFHSAWGVMVGEPGRGIPILVEMAAYTRLDNVLASAGFIRRAFAQALHYARHRYAFGKALVDQPSMTELLADIALETQGATLLGMDLAARFGTSDPLDAAWRRLITPAAKFWVCKRAVTVVAEAMEVFGGNGYVEIGAMGRLFREAPVSSIWEGAGNVMCLDVLRAVARDPEGTARVLDWLDAATAGEARVRAQVRRVREALQRPAAEQERQARCTAQRLALCAQAALLLKHGSATIAQAFIASRFDPDWGALVGVRSGSSHPATLLRESWIEDAAGQATAAETIQQTA